MMQIEFGEKLKKCREEKGMTQQTLANQLYVTRQAVSRWECGARYPDLITAKRIADELEISLDELVSGEKYVRDIEKEAVITASAPLLIQTALYAVACVPFLLMGLFEIISVIPRGSVSEAADTEINVWMVRAIAYNFVYLVLMGIGLYYSIRNKLSPRRVGWIMSVCLWAKGAVYFAILLHMLPMLMKGNGTLTWDSKLYILFYCVAPFIILGFFNNKKHLNVKYIYTVVIIMVAFYFRSLYTYWNFLWSLFDFDSIVDLINIIGDLAYILLLAFQSYTLNKKRAAANS